MSDRSRQLERRLADLERQLARLGGTPPAPAAAPRLRMAKTALDPDTGQYPTAPANTYWIVFLDGAFDPGVHGNQSRTLYDRQDVYAARATAQFLEASPALIPEGSLVWVSWQTGRWWIVAGPPASNIKNYELKTDLAGTYGATCTAYEIDADNNRVVGSEFTLTCGPACHEGDGSTEGGADGYGYEGTGHTGSAAWKNGRWETQSMSCNVKPAS